MTKFRHYQLNLKFFASLFWVIGFLLCGLPAHLHAAATITNTDIEQNKTITGNVVSADDNMGIPGVNILVKGASTGAVTDFDGNYSIDVPSNGAVLVFSYLGFVTQEVIVGANTSINVTMETDLTSLDEVVVVGYGTAKKETLTGAVEQIKAEVFEDRAVTNVALALQGQTPGLIVSRNSSRPGNENIDLQIRGATSVNGGTPLIIIDGAPAFDNSEFFQMNPDDIESMSILKDGAASIYGSRAANGVILVTTKKGKGKMKVEFNSQLRMNFLGINPPNPTMQQYGQLWLDAAEQDVASGGVANYWNWGQEAVEFFAAGQSGFVQTPTQGWGYDGLIYMAPARRYNELYGSNTGHQQSISLSGSSEQARYRLSMGLSESEGALKTAVDGIKQYSVRLNTDFDISEKLNLAANISLNKNTTSSPSSGFGRGLVGQDAPVFPSRTDDGLWYANFGIGNTNSVAATVDGGRNNVEENIAKVALNLKYDIGYGFSANANATLNHVNSRQNITTIEVPLYNWNGELENSINNNPRIDTQHITKEYQTYGAFLNYEKSLKDIHNFKAMVGITAEKNDFQQVSGRRLGFVDEGVSDLNVGTGVQTNAGGQTQEGLYSYLARINYDYKEKYLVEFVGRRDGSSRFAPGFKFSDYGGVSVGWNIHKEIFMENFDVISNLKLRGSIGSSGNQVGIGPYDYVSTISTGTELFGEGGTLSPTAWISGLTTTTRTWESVEMKNIAIDFSLFNNKLSGTFETYERENNGMLIPITYPEVLGSSAPATNAGNLVTTGWEAMLNLKGGKGDFSYNVGVNMSDSNNILVNLEGGNLIQNGLRRTVEGFPLNSYFLWQTDGLFQTQAEVDAYNALYDVGGSEVPNGASALRVGDTRKVDVDGNGVINDQNADDPNGKGQGDVVFSGDAQAHYTFGINLGARYKGFDFTAFFQGQLEQTIIRDGVDSFPFNNPWPNQTIAFNGLTWTPDNTGATYPRLTAQRGLARWNWSNTDVFAQNNKYIRLKTLVVGYSLPSDILEKLKMTKVRFYFSGNDLFEFSSLIDNFDPESAKTSAETNANIRRSVYPFQRTVAFGVNLAF